MFVSVSLLLFMCIPVVGRVIYVDDDAVGGNNGTSWSDAYNFLQDALEDANTMEKPVEIRVAQGIYTPDRGAGITRGNSGATFRLINGVTIKGGFAGYPGTDPDARNVEAYETVLSGDLSGDDADFIDPQELSSEPTRAENSFTIVTGDDTDETAVLDGVTVTASTSTGMRNSYGAPVLKNCTFTSHRTGMYNLRSHPRLIACTFKGHSLSAIGNNGGSLILTNCLFTGNSGVSIDSHANNELTLHNCVFKANNKGAHEAIDCWGKNLRMYNCEFRNNIADSVAGIWALIEEEFIAENCIFAGNRGRAIDCHQGRMVVSNCLFAGNIEGSWTGGINSWSEYTIIRNCTFSGNSGSLGGALNLICGGSVSHCIFWNNDSPAIEGREQEIAVTYCTLQDDWSGEGNINVDPCFVGPGYWDSNGTPDDSDDDFWVDGDYHLRSQAGRWEPVRQTWVKDEVTSLCIDAGDPNAPIGTEPFPNGGRVNMGAFGAAEKASKSYFGEPVCQTVIAGDINGDCVVDSNDLAILSSHWMMSGEDFVNKPPTVRLLEPQDGDRIVWPGPTTFRAEASDSNGRVNELSFKIQHKTSTSTRTLGLGGDLVNGVWVRQYDWQSDNELPYGNWTVWAEARDNEGTIGLSPEIVITLQRY
ncbi:MAG: right-handed parallel beta-helix repeat-containing protein [Sedimentisphaerales bacterium]|nr:right-handed parallel beta-helix repeat-containing protein [Sedimentisphaerales bacterium]